MSDLRRWPTLRSAVWEMTYDSGGHPMSPCETDERIRVALYYHPTARLDEAEHWLMYLNNAGGLDSVWYTAICGEYYELQKLVPPDIHNVLDTLFDSEIPDEASKEGAPALSRNEAVAPPLSSPPARAGV